MKAPFSTKIFSLAAIVPILATPLASHANAAMDACIEAFIASTLPKDHPVKVRKKSAGDSPLGVYSASREIELTARISRTGEPVAKATCIVDRDGVVIALNGAPTMQRVAGVPEKTAAR